MTFYSETADTVTDLLTEFGQAITITRESSVFDAVKGRDISVSSESLSTVGIWQVISAKLIDGTRIRLGDKFLVIDGTVAPRMGDRIDGWSIVEITEINPAGTVLAYKLLVRK